MTDSVELTEAEKKEHKWRDILISVAALIIALGLCALVLFDWEFVNQFRRFEYLGLFIIGILTGSVAVIPIPGLILVFALGSVLFPPLVGLFSGLGEALGSILKYLSGYGGHRVIQKVGNRFTDQFETWLKKRGSLAVVLMSAIANPLFMPFTAVAGMMRFGLVKFFLLCLLGKTVKNVTVAYLGYFGLGAILRWIGVTI